MRVAEGPFRVIRQEKLIDRLSCFCHAECLVGDCYHHRRTLCRQVQG